MRSLAVKVDKKVYLELGVLDGNAFVLMGAFQKQARREGWTQEEIKKVLDECRKSDYDHLIQTLMAHCVGSGIGGDEDNEDV